MADTPKLTRANTTPAKSGVAASATTPLFTRENADGKLRSVMKSVNSVISKSENLKNLTQSAAKSTNAAVEAYVPKVLEYLPEKKVGPELVVIISLVLLVFLLVSLGATHLLIDTASVIYPCYASIVALESPQPEDDKQWLTYWLIFTFMKLTDRFTRPVLSFIPFFPVFKILGFGWLYHPDFLGAKLVYGVMQPTFRQVIDFFDPEFNMSPSQKLEFQEKKKTTMALKKVDNDRLKEDVNKVKPLADITDKENNSKSPKKSNNNAAAAVNKKSTTSTSEDGAQLTVVLKSTSYPVEHNFYCEASVVPPSSREKKGIEGIVYKTDKINGASCSFNKSMTFCPLTLLDGDLIVTIFEKPTFSDAKPLGQVKFSLLDVSPGATAVTSTVNAKYIDGEKKGKDVEGLQLTLSMQLVVG